MRALLQRVSKASLSIEDKPVSSIGKGLVVLLGIGEQDTELEAAELAEKIVNLRIFEDADQKMNLSCLDVNGEILAVSQFTLYADTSRGRRPSFIHAAKPPVAFPLYEYFVESLRSMGVTVQTGVFGEHMLVEIHNDGPVTIMLEYPSFDD